MAVSFVSEPLNVSSGLRCVTFVMTIDSVGVAPEKKYLQYRLKNVTDGTYLTKWKTYEPVTDGQQISIDFYKDLFGILSTIQPPFYNPTTMVSTVSNIKTILVEIREKTVNLETCESTVGATVSSNWHDVINYAPMIFAKGISQTGMLLTNRPKQIPMTIGTEDWVYAIGTIYVAVIYLSETGILGSSNFASTETHPGSVCNIIPCGWQLAPAGTTKIAVMASTSGFPSGFSGLQWVTIGEQCGCDDYATLYMQNELGGCDTLSMDCIDSKVMDVQKQEIVQKYLCDSDGSGVQYQGQRHSINNTSKSLITLRKKFDRMTFNDSKWLDGLVAAGSAWITDVNYQGLNIALRFQIQNAQYPTFSYEELEVSLSGYYSEIQFFPYSL